MKINVTLALSLALPALAIVAACSSGNDAASDPSSPTCFLAINSTFAGFRDWTSFAFDGGADGDGGVHVSGPRIEYVNAMPPTSDDDAGAAAFPIRTVIVKEVGIDDPANHHLFAMVKRNCDPPFNAGGAVGWEYFELTEPGGVVGANATIKWRGVGPPAGETYGGDSTTCNACHAGCSDNDSICSSRVRLAGH